jgi:DNA-binding NtrC family response regulator
VSNVDNGALVLVVDPDELLRWSVAQSLTEHGYRVRLRAHPGEAFGCADAAVALLDHDLPHVDGLATATELRRRCPGCVVVLMCPDSSPPIRRQATEEGIARVLEKPFSLEALLDAVRRAMGDVQPGFQAPDAGPFASGEEEAHARGNP